MLDSDGRPLHVSWRYNRAELMADGVVHVVGIALAAMAAVAMIILSALRSDATELAAVVIYALCLVAGMSVSAAYNMWPVSPVKWRLRRFDHALIFLLIAGTYTPFVSRMSGPGASALLVGVWSVALVGAGLKVLMPGRYDRLSIALCLLLGASGALAWETVSSALSTTTLGLIIAGGLIYAGGVVFHLWEGLRFQNAVWHGFVLVASAVFYSAILGGVVLA